MTPMPTTPTPQLPLNTGAEVPQVGFGVFQVPPAQTAAAVAEALAAGYDPAITGIAQAFERTPAQVVLRWHVQLGNVVIPKSVTPERIRSNLALFDFALDDEPMAAIAALDRGERIGPDPDRLG
jgi:diketogulonate reductase-like aldo/keto reductase